MTGYDRKKHRTFRRGLAAVFGILAVLAVVWHLGTAAAALFRTEDAIHIEPGSVENSTLAIGTHLIYLHSLNEEIYAIALDSASASGQDKWYYKSELAGGMWLDISDAGFIEDITAAGKIVDESEIRQLYFTHHTKSDGITYSLKTNGQVCIFDITNVYDLEYMPELEAVKMQYDMMQESGDSTKTAVRNRNNVRNFFASQVRSDVTDRCDAQLQALQGYYNELAENGADSRELQTVLMVMEKVDYTRKAAVYTRVDSLLGSLQDKVADVTDADGELELDDNLLTAIGDSRYAVAESLTQAQGNMLAKGNTVLSESEYTLSNRMITNAESADYFSCDEQNQKLQYLDNISGGRIVSRQEELEFLEELVDAADVRYGVALSGGVTQQYTALVEQNVSHAALRNRMQSDMADANAARSELQFLLQAKVDRQEEKEAQDYVLLRIQDAAKFRTVIKSDAYQQEYRNGVDAYVDWLNSLLSNIKEDIDSQSREETLYEQKAALQEQKLQALDNLDLDTAKRIDAKIADIDEKIGASGSGLEEQLEDLMQKKADLERQIAENLQNAIISEDTSDSQDKTDSDSTSDSRDKTDSDSTSDSQSTADSDSENSSDTQSKTDSDSSSDSQSKTDLDSSSDSQSKIDSDSSSDSQSKTDSENTSNSPSKSDSDSSSDSQNTTDSDSDNSSDSQSKTDSDSSSDSQSKTDSESASDSQIAVLQAQLSRLEVEIANCQANLPADSQAANIMACKSEILSLLADGDTSDTAVALLESDMDLLVSMLNDGSALALEASKEVYQKLLAKSELEGVESAAYQEFQEQLETAVSESVVRASLTGELSVEGAEDIIASALGIDGLVGEDGNLSGEIANVSQEELAACLIALGDFCKRTDAEEIQELAQGLASALGQSESGAVFPAKKQGEEAYVPAEVLAVYLGYRYVWNDTKMNAVLSRGRYFFSFTAFRESVENEAGETIYMKSPAGFSGVLYIPGAFATEQFDCYICDISGTDYSVLVNDRVIERSREILSELLEEGGY